MKNTENKKTNNSTSYKKIFAGMALMSTLVVGAGIGMTGIFSFAQTADENASSNPGFSQRGMQVDYSSCPMQEDITPEQQQVIDRARELRQDGEYEQARKIMEDIGFGAAGMMRKGQHGTAADSEHRASVQEAVENGNYDAFLKAIEGTGREGTADKETFNTMTRAHNLHEQGNYKKARELMRESEWSRGRANGWQQN